MWWTVKYESPFVVKAKQKAQARVDASRKKEKLHSQNQFNQQFKSQHNEAPRDWVVETKAPGLFDPKLKKIEMFPIEPRHRIVDTRNRAKLSYGSNGSDSRMSNGIVSHNTHTYVVNSPTRNHNSPVPLPAAPPRLTTRTNGVSMYLNFVSLTSFLIFTFQSAPLNGPARFRGPTSPSRYDEEVEEEVDLMRDTHMRQDSGFEADNFIVNHQVCFIHMTII